MIIVWATVRVRPERVEIYESEVRRLLPLVRANEPGLVVYEAAPVQDKPLTYKSIEVFKDQAALRSHIQNEERKRSFADIYESLDGDPVIEFYETL